MSRGVTGAAAPVGWVADKTGAQRGLGSAGRGLRPPIVLIEHIAEIFYNKALNLRCRR